MNGNFRLTNPVMLLLSSLSRIVFCFVLIASGTVLAFGISWIRSSDIPDPFSQDIILGKVITEIRIEGNENTKESVIQRALNSDVGDVYTEELARSDRKWLFQLGVITSIFFDTIPDGDGVGLRLIVPSIVMVRFDLAFGEEGAGAGIFIGSQEKPVLQRDRVR